jgi:chemotaxis signal transduction protein
MRRDYLAGPPARMTVRSCREATQRPQFGRVHQRRDEVVSAQTLLRFELDHEHWAVQADLVMEIQRAALPVAMRDGPRLVRGLVNVRGEMVPLVDLRATLRLPARPLRASDQLVICRIGQRTLCFAVDRAIDLIEIEAEPGAADRLRVIPDLAALLE